MIDTGIQLVPSCAPKGECMNTNILFTFKRRPRNLQKGLREDRRTTPLFCTCSSDKNLRHHICFI